MAKRGLSTFLHAPLDMDTKTYGEIKKTGGAIEYNESINNNNYKHYEDDELQWEDASFKDGTIKLTVGDDNDEIFAELVGRKTKKITVGGEEIEVVQGGTDDITIPVGFGFVEGIMNKKGNYFRVKFYPNVTFKPYSTDGKTKNDSSDYITQSVEGTIGTLDGTYIVYKTVKEQAEAIKILYALFGKEVPGTETHVYTQSELEALTIDKIKEIATDRGYTITKTLKDEIITEFLAQQTA